jgi:hypothetical protein
MTAENVEKCITSTEAHSESMIVLVSAQIGGYAMGLQTGPGPNAITIPPPKAAEYHLA